MAEQAQRIRRRRCGEELEAELLEAAWKDLVEAGFGRIPPAVLAMPFDLMRHDMLMTYTPIPPQRVLAIVDDLFMPLAISHPGKPGD